MKRWLLLGLVLLASGCAHWKWEPDWQFDCEWARFWDFQNAARARTMGMPYWPNQWTHIYCEGDPTSLDYWSRKKSKAAERELPDERR